MKLVLIKIIVYLWLIFLVSSHRADENEVKYLIEITDASHHLAEVTVLFPRTESGTIDFIMPAWRLGKYQILNLANGIRNFRVSDSSGDKVYVQKIDKSTWRATLDKPSKLAVSYDLYANQLESRVRHIDDTHAYLDGVGTFIYSPEFKNLKLSVELDVPKGWQSRSGMEKKAKHLFQADNYQVLASSPIETGIHEYYSFKADGKKYELVIWGDGNFSGKKIVDDYKKMVVEHGKLWGDYPFDRYLFIVHAAPGLRGATEHINSTVIQRDAMGFKKTEDYNKFLSTSSHEFVHTWNVKSYRPWGLHDYDYTQENYTDLLWITEGSTSYFGDILLVRAGLLSVKDYLKNMAKNIRAYQQRPGSKVMSAQQASFDVWIEPSGDRAHNASVNIYKKGNLLSFLMDVILLKDTNAEAGYAELHKILYQRFPIPDKGFTAKDIQQLMQELSGEDYSTFWKSYMESTKSIDFDQLLSELGLRFADPEPGKDSQRTLVTGIKLNKTKNMNQISILSKGTPGWEAGLASGDTLVAVNGIKVEPGKFSLLLGKFQQEDEVKISFFRRNRLLETIMKIESIVTVKPNIVHSDSPTEQQKITYKKWLGVDWPTKSKVNSAE